MLVSTNPTAVMLLLKWHGWLGKFVQEPPTEQDFVAKKWWGEPTPNFSGTPKAFKTYNTTRPKINAWEPIVKARPQI
ncbi:unnamed protein product [Absidia cylindrospora]